MYLCTLVRMYISMYVCMYVCLSMYVFRYVYVCMYLCMYVCMHASMQAYTRVCVCVCACMYECAHTSICYVYIYGLHIREFLTLACRSLRGFPRLVAVRMVQGGLLRWCVLFMGPQYGVCFVSHLWHLKFGSDLSIFGKRTAYIVNKLNVSTGNSLQTCRRSYIFPTSGSSRLPFSVTPVIIGSRHGLTSCKIWPFICTSVVA